MFRDIYFGSIFRVLWGTPCSKYSENLRTLGQGTVVASTPAKPLCITITVHVSGKTRQSNTVQQPIAKRGDREEGNHSSIYTFHVILRN